MVREYKKYDYLDSMRGLATLLVVLGHVGNMIGDLAYKYFPTYLQEFVYNGHLGVQMFFIVSAFTLLMSYDNRKGEVQATKKFFIRRFFRIAPMYYLAIAFTALQMIDFNFANFDWATFHKKAFVTNVLFINALSPTTINNFVIGGWSISVEFMFYLMLPFICAKIKSLNGFVTFTLLTLLLSSLLLFLLRGTAVDGNEFLRYYFFNHLPVFGLGMTAYWINKEGHSAGLKPKVLLLLLVTIFIYCFVELPYAIPYSLVYFVLLLTQSRKAYRIFNNKVLVAIGKVSFSIYLVHFAVMYLMYRWNFVKYFTEINSVFSAYSNFILLFIVLTTISYFISWITYKYVEQKGQNIGRIIIKKMDLKYNQNN